MECKKIGFGCDDKIIEYENLILNELFYCLSLSKREQILIEDTLRFNLDLFKNNYNSIGFKRTLKPENKLYAQQLCSDINTFLDNSKTKVHATIYDVQLCDPLNLIVLHFNSTAKEIEIKEIQDLRNQLQILEQYTIHKKAPSIYMQKHLRYYDDNVVYLIKPNQKRFWTRSQAMDDASSLISEIINMTN